MMRKLGILIMPIMAISFLVGCNGGGKKPEAPTFSITESSVDYDSINNTAVVHLDWTPSGDSIEISNLAFTYSGDKTASKVEQGDVTARPREITITFNEDLTNSITDGKLNFHYEDNVSEIEDDGVVENINIIVSEAPAFSITDSSIYYNSTNKTAVVHIAWEPPIYSLQLSYITFTYNSGAKEASNVEQDETNLKEITITFNEDLTENITDGKLSFTYIDYTARIVGDGEINNIRIIIPKIYTVTCTSTDVTLSNLEARTDKDYVTTITVNTEKINQGKGYSVPDTLNIQTGTAFLDPDDGDYTYTPTENTFSAELVIPKENIAGAITISLAVKELTPLCFTGEEGGASINFSTLSTVSDINLQISSDNVEWDDWPDNDGRPVTQNLDKGKTLYVKNTTNTLSTEEGFLFFNLSGSVAVSGNVNSMINYAALTANCFKRLFFNCSEITSAPALPATTLETSCYCSMFEKCTNLTSAPALPATVLAEQCYRTMFDGCSEITSAPFLPATTNNFAALCYESMFRNCSNLTYVKVGFDGGGTLIEWPEGKTDTWLEGVASKGTFVWKGSLDGPATRGVNTVPSGWTCEHYD